MNLQEILDQSPDVPGYGGGKWAMYSVHCCWWTSFPDDLGQLPPVKYDPKVKRIKPNPGGHGLPCCPHCGSVLMQAPLDKFVQAAQASHEHYGDFGIDAFLEAHSRNSKKCHRSWDQYNSDIRRRFGPKEPPPTYA